MDLGKPTGFQLTFLLTALLLLSVPTVQFLGAWLPADENIRDTFLRAFPLMVLAVAFACVPPLRRWVAREMARPIPASRRTEILAAWGLHVIAAFAFMGAYVLWWDFREGAAALEQRMNSAGTHAQAMADALSSHRIVFHLLAAGLLAPVIEEIVFRGFLYRAWARQFGWVTALVLTSAVFGLYHKNFLIAFMGSAIYVCLYRRTGTLLAPMIVHAAFNMSIWYPLLGRWIYPRDLAAPGDVQSWTLHVLALAFCVVALPVYAWFSRDALSLAPTGSDDARAPLPR